MRIPRWTLACGVITLASTLSAQSAPRQATEPTVALYENARLISGSGSAPLEESAFLVERGTITRVARKGGLTPPAGARRVDLTGKTVMPVLINTHGHPGFQKGLTYGQENFTRETIVDDLNRALYYGVAVVQSQGIEKGEVTYQVRADQQAGRLGGARLLVAGRGIGAPNAGPGAAAYAGIAHEITNEAEARAAVQELAAKKVDLVKIWVDDRMGRAPRLAPNLYRAAIAEAHARALRVNAHVYYYSDAVDLADAGIDAFAHLVRDKEMDDALVASIVRRNVYVMPNLTGEWNTYSELPRWLKDGDPLLILLQQSTPQAVIDRMRKGYEGRTTEAIERARTQHSILERSLTRLARANAKIVLGSDTGLPDRLFGMAEQRELESMVKAGMTPMQVIVAATSRPAEYLKLSTMGSLEPGKEASFLVLDANPLDDITNTQRLSRVFVKGEEVDRAGLRPALTR
jgi:imidazolonepropionase-like amidohydrolase